MLFWTVWLLTTCAFLELGFFWKVLFRYSEYPKSEVILYVPGPGVSKVTSTYISWSRQCLERLFACNAPFELPLTFTECTTTTGHCSSLDLESLLLSLSLICQIFLHFEKSLHFLELDTENLRKTRSLSTLLSNLSTNLVLAHIVLDHKMLTWNLILILVKILPE